MEDKVSGRKVSQEAKAVNEVRNARVWNRGGTVKVRETHEGDITNQLHNQLDGERERNQVMQSGHGTYNLITHLVTTRKTGAC